MSCSEKDSEFEDLNDLINDIGNDDQILDNIITKPKKIIKVNFPENSKILDEVLFGNKKNFAEKLQQEDLIFDDISEREKNFQAPTSVWHDSDDDDVEKSLELKSKRKFERITSVTPSWASFNKKKKQKAEDSDEDIEISQNVGHLSTEHNEDVAISKNSLKFKRLANMNKITKREGKISVVDFHPRSTVGIVAGIHGMVSLFAIDGEENKKVTMFMSNLQ
jgi:U3 small nucleolar RNA-associated protein 18